MGSNAHLGLVGQKVDLTGDLILGLSNPYRVAIPTELSKPTIRATRVPGNAAVYDNRRKGSLKPNAF